MLGDKEVAEREDNVDKGLLGELRVGKKTGMGGEQAENKADPKNRCWISWGSRSSIGVGVKPEE